MSQAKIYFDVHSGSYSTVNCFEGRIGVVCVAQVRFSNSVVLLTRTVLLRKHCNVVHVRVLKSIQGSTGVVLLLQK